MDLTEWLLRRAAPRPLVVTAPGGTGARLGVERHLRRRGWRHALSPAEADLLVACGPEVPGFEEAVRRVWEQVPGPRVHVVVRTADEAARALDAAQVGLRDTAAHRGDAASRESAARDGRSGPSHENSGEGGPSHEGHGAGGEAGENAEDSGEGHQHHAHGGGMDMPGGLPMADRAPDRDGLTLDRTHLALGPALPDWPAGLRLDLALQGDVVQDVETVVLERPEPASPPFWDAAAGTGSHAGRALRSAAALDGLGRFLAVAGWPGAATTARRLRDQRLRFPVPERPPADLARWARRVRRSRTLRWLTTGLGPVGAPAPPELRGDVADRVLRRLDEAAAPSPDRRAESAPPGEADRRGESARAAVELLPELLRGQELAAVRLIVASLDPDLDHLAETAGRAAHG